MGLIFSQSLPPIQGAGREMRPRLVEKRPKAVPRRRSGTALEMSEL